MHRTLHRAISATALLSVISMPVSAFAASVNVNASTTTSVHQSTRTNDDGTTQTETYRATITNDNGKITTSTERTVNGKTESSKSTNTKITSGSSLRSQLRWNWAATNTGSQIDARFLEQLILHHEGGIRLARQAARNAEHAELRTLAQSMVDAEKKDVKLLKQMRRGANKLGLTERMALRWNMRAEQRQLEKKLRGLRGNEYDKAFLDVMIEHHQVGQGILNEAKTKAALESLRTLATTMADKQQKEIDQMKSWRSSW